VDKLERQVERYRDKRTHEPRRAVQRKPPAAPPAPVELPAEAVETDAGEQDEAAA
jgi:hypothetical protein